MENIIKNTVSGPWNYVEESTDTQVSITYPDEKTLLIKFQGSCSDVDWKNNFNFIKKPYKQMKKTFFIHSGFLKIYKSVRKRLHNSFNSDIENIKIQGYSLGGAIATLCFEDFFWHKENVEEYKDINLFGFGLAAPKVVSLWNYKEFNRRCSGFLRMENGNDVVVKVPFSFLFFKHVQKDKVIKTNKKRNLFYLLFPSAVYDHDDSSYIGFYKDKNYKDDSWLKNKAIKIYKYIYIGIGIAVLLAIILKVII